MTLEEIIEAIRDYQKDLNDDQRMGVWGLITDGYCDRCGRKLRDGERCHCWNDE